MIEPHQTNNDLLGLVSVYQTYAKDLRPTAASALTRGWSDE